MDEYAARVEANLGRLERAEIATAQDIKRVQQELVRAVADIELEMDALRKELVLLQQEMGATVNRAKTTVAGFKNTVKKGDLQRLQSRVDLWAPEQRITREQFKRLLES